MPRQQVSPMRYVDRKYQQHNDNEVSIYIQQENDVARLHQQPILSAVMARPTFVVVKSEGCYHCNAMRNDLHRLVQTLKGSGVNAIVIEASALIHAGENSPNPLLALLNKERVPYQGVPYIAVARSAHSPPRISNGQQRMRLVVYPPGARRDPVSMARFVLHTVRRNVDQTRRSRARRIHAKSSAKVPTRINSMRTRTLNPNLNSMRTRTLNPNLKPKNPK